MEEKRERAQSTLAAAAAAVISLVLGDHDLLAEILLRLGFPTDLVCAASDPSFLHRFRDLHPPHLLGFYITTFPSVRYGVDFVAMQPQPSELSAVLRWGRFSLDTDDSKSTHVMDCRNGRVILGLRSGNDFNLGVHSPFHPARCLVIFPTRPILDVPDRDSKVPIVHEVLSKECGHGLSYFLLSLVYCEKEEKATAYVHKLQDDAWSMHTSAIIHIARLQMSRLRPTSIFLAEDKIYMGITTHNILVLDLTSSAFSTIKFPDRMTFGGEIILSQDNGYGVYLVHVDRLQLCIWLHRGCNGSIGDWLLVDTISLCDLCANLKLSNSTTEDGHAPDVYIHVVGDNAEYIFLEMYKCVLYLDVKSRAL